MTLETILHYLEVIAILAPTLGIIGHALAATPWTITKAIGNALNAISVDFGDLARSVKNAKDAVADPTGGTVALAKAVTAGALTPIGGDTFQAPPGSKARIESVAPPKLPPMFPGATLMLLLAALCLPVLTACNTLGGEGPGASQPTKPADSGALAADLAKSIHAGAVLAVRALDDVNAKWIDSVKVPSPAQLDVMRATTAALGKARDLLNSTADVDQVIVEVAQQLFIVQTELGAVGLAPPKEAEPVLALIRSYARARGAS